jgi:hypothetical protein
MTPSKAHPPRGYHQRLKTPLQRFEEKFTRSEKCWEWNGAAHALGYGHFYFQGRNRRAHAVSKHLYEGFPIDANALKGGLEWDHLCRNPRCVRPEHLELVSKKINNLRGTSPAAMNKRKATCPAGHELTDGNLLEKEKGYRSCRKCHREREKKYYKKQASKNVRRDANGIQSHCKRGHPLSGENIRVAPQGFRRCKACVKITDELRRSGASVSDPKIYSQIEHEALLAEADHKGRAAAYQDAYEHVAEVASSKLAHLPKYLRDMAKLEARAAAQAAPVGEGE